MSTADWANEQVAAVRDDPAARIDLVQRLYHGPYGTRPGTCRIGEPQCRSCAGNYAAVCWSQRTTSGPGVRGGEQ
jgi:hypothetical protein